jgi:hypothetical protein
MTQIDTSRVLCPAYRRLINQDVCQWHAQGGWGQQPDPKCQGCKVAKPLDKEEGTNEFGSR